MTVASPSKNWDDQAGALYTQGTAQFGAPEIWLSKPPNADPLMVDSLFPVAQSVLTLHHSIPDGKTDGQPPRQAENR
jgi:hypothetical protein